MDTEPQLAPALQASARAPSLTRTNLPLALVALATLLALLVMTGCGGAPGRDIDYTSSEDDLTSCPGAHTLQGADVSMYQGNIDWSAFAGSGRTFAITRVSDGFYFDPDFDRNWAGIKRAGLVRGVYQFFRPRKDPIAQADLLLRHTGPLGAGDLPPVLDVEVTDGASPAQLRAGILAWVQHIEARTGKRPIIYVGSYFWDDNVKGGSEWSKYPLWLPAYGPVCPRLPSAWGSWVMHQYSSTARIPGIGGNVDVNVFNGTLAELKKLAGETAPPPPPPPTCGSHCEGSVMVNGACSRYDCGAHGARCVNDSIGLRCVFSACPNTGEADLCLSTSEVAHCKNGALSSKGNCGAYGAWCSTAGRTATQARCVSSLCVSGPHEVPKAHTVCASHGTGVVSCDANGAPTVEACDDGYQCSTLDGGPHCDWKRCPASGQVDVCLDVSQVGHCEDGSLRGSFDCSVAGLACGAAGGNARCVSEVCTGGAEAVPPPHDVCVDSGTVGHCDSGGTLIPEACADTETCTVTAKGPVCVDDRCLDGAATAPPAHDLCLEDGALGKCDSLGVLSVTACGAGTACTSSGSGAACAAAPGNGGTGGADGGTTGTGGTGGTGTDGGTDPGSGNTDGGPIDTVAPSGGCAEPGAGGILSLLGLCAVRLRKRSAREMQ